MRTWARRTPRRMRQTESEYLCSSFWVTLLFRSPAKSKRAKGFMFGGSAKKDKEKKKEARDQSVEAGGKKKEKKDKPKLKLITKASKDIDGVAGQVGEDEPTKAEEGFQPIFGVPLAMAVERDRSHDGVLLPSVVRRCIDHVEDNGLMQEGIYRSSGVKSKVNKLRAAFEARKPVNLHDYEPAVVASVLKQFLRELPEPVLTAELSPRFERVAAESSPQVRIEGVKRLINEDLPVFNRALVQYIFAHMNHVIERERFNKMTLQNVSIVLSPTLQISHRVLNCLFENRHILFDAVVIKRYVPPLTAEPGQQVALPDAPADIEEEIGKQESLLTDLHLRISSGAASKKVEEQAWEQQRIVTQLKRKLRMAKHSSEGQLNLEGGKFKPIEYEEELNFALQTPSHLKEPESEPVSEEPSPEEEPEGGAEHKVTVMVHQEKESELGVDVTDDADPVKTVIKVEGKEDEASMEPKKLSSESKHFPLLPPPPASHKMRQGTASVLRPTPASPRPVKAKPEPSAKSKSLPRGLPSDGSAFDTFLMGDLEDKASDAGPQGKEDSPEDVDGKLLVVDDEIDHDIFSDETWESLLLEEARARFEFEELNVLRSELELRKAAERKEMQELREELATMQTLYQYRTCSVDSSESSSEGEEEETSTKERKKSEADANREEEVEELTRTLKDLIRENGELQEKKQELCQKIQEERAACVNLRVEIRVEQERQRMKKGRMQAQQ